MREEGLGGASAARTEAAEPGRRQDRRGCPRTCPRGETQRVRPGAPVVLRGPMRPQGPPMLPSRGRLGQSVQSQQASPLRRWSCHVTPAPPKPPRATAGPSEPTVPTEPAPTNLPGFSIPYHATYVSWNALEIHCHVAGGTLLGLSAPVGPLLPTAGSRASQPNPQSTFTSITAPDGHGGAHRGPPQRGPGQN